MKCFDSTSLFCAVAVQLVIAALCLDARSESCGSVAGINGTVEILRLQRNGAGGDEVRNGFIVKRDLEPVECDDVIIAGKDSTAKLILGDAKIVLGSDTRVEVAAYKKRSGAGGAQGEAQVSLLALSYGKLRALVRKPAPSGEEKPSTGKSPERSSGASTEVQRRSGAERFQIKTTTAVAGVRGTDFFASYDPNTSVMDQATLEGSVRVQHLKTKKEVIVSSGQQTKAEPLLESELGDSSQRRDRLLEVKPLNERTKNLIRVVSNSVRKDEEFTQPSVVKQLGSPETWPATVVEIKEVPPKDDGLKNEF